MPQHWRLPSLRQGSGKETQRREGRVGGDPYSPWQMNDGWRVNDRGHVDLLFLDGEEEVTVVAYMDGDGISDGHP